VIHFLTDPNRTGARHLFGPDPAILEGLSTDPNDPVCVMWKGTPYAHIMVKIAADD